VAYQFHAVELHVKCRVRLWSLLYGAVGGNGVGV